MGLPFKISYSKAAFIEFWNESAQGVNMFVWITAPKQGSVMFCLSLLWFYEKTKWFMGDS